MTPRDVIVAGNWGTLHRTAQRHGITPDTGKLTTPGAKGQATGGDTPLANYPQTLAAFHVRGKVGPLPVSFLVDTGAAVNLLRKDHADRVTTPQTPRRALEQPLVSVDGSPLKIHGRVTLPVNLGGLVSEVQFAIAEDLTVDAILGLEFLAGHQGMLNFRTGVLDLPHVEIPLVPISSTKSRAVPVSVVEDIRIPPSCELDIMGHFSPIPIGDYLLEQTTGKSLPVRVARALVSATEKGVPLRLINPST